MCLCESASCFRLCTHTHARAQSHGSSEGERERENERENEREREREREASHQVRSAQDTEWTRDGRQRGTKLPAGYMDGEDLSDLRNPFGRNASGVASTAIIGAEDEEFENDIGSVDDNCSHFQCIELLKDRPTYLIIFLHHVILQFDASSVLCYLHGEMFRMANIKDARRMFVDFFHTFLDRAAVLRVAVPFEITFELDRTRHDMLPEDSLKNIIRVMQKTLAQDIYIQLEDFRNKRLMGMTIGEKELLELDDRESDRDTLENKERQFAEQLLIKVEEATANTDDDKSATIYNAVVTYMKYLGVKPREPRVMEKKRHFLMRRKGPNPRKEIEPVKTDEKKRKGIGSILDLRRQTRNDPASSSDLRPDSVKQAMDRKNSGIASKFQTENSSGKNKGDGSDIPGISASGSSSARDEAEGETVHTSVTIRLPNEIQSFREPSDGGQRGTSGETAAGGDTGADEGGETESPDTGGSGGSGGADSQQCFLPAQSEDNGGRAPEVEAEPPSWRQLISNDLLLRLKKSEVKRQEVINELFITEHAHVRMLRVLFEVFYKRMLDESILTHNELQSIFPSLDELIEVHASFYENMRKIREDDGYLVSEIGNTLLAMFHGTEGDWFKKLASRLCSLQSFALEIIKSKGRKDPKFSQFIQDAQSNPQCRRLQLKDIIPMEMQRLTKYPLLLENIAKSTEAAEEKQKVLQAADCCRNILKDVNQDVRETENLRRLHDYQRRLDVTNLKQSTDPFVVELVKNLDLTQKRMVHEGPLVWRVTKEKAIDIHVLLLEDILVLMQKLDDRMVLKCHSKVASTTGEGKQMLVPIIRLGTVLARDVATDRKAFFILFQAGTGPQIYELVAQTVSERRSWCEKIQSTQEALKLARPVTSGRSSLVPPPGITPLSPTESMMNTENGFSIRDRVSMDISAGRELEVPGGEGGGYEGGSEEAPTLATQLAAQLRAVDIDLTKLTSGPGDQWAALALEDVHKMKRDLSTSIRSSKDALHPASTSEDTSPTGHECEDGPEAPGEGEEQEESEGEDGAGKMASIDGAGAELETTGCAIVLSRSETEKMERRMNSLLVKIQHLKTIEDEYSRMRQALVNVMSPRNQQANVRRVSGERW